ncbi:MAG: hypothetical protein Q9211_000248 [Gyalolechia sp. 1 TL-2023]
MINDCVRLYLQSSVHPGVTSPNVGARTLRTGISKPARQRGHVQTNSINELQETDDTVLTQLALDKLSAMRVGKSRGQVLHHYAPYLSTSLPSTLPRAGLEAGVQVDAPSSLLKARFSPSFTSPSRQTQQSPQRAQNEENNVSHTVFRLVEDYIVECFCTCDTLNKSFLSPRPAAPKRSVSEGTETGMFQPSKSREDHEDFFDLELDAKTLLLGDVAENGAWWLGKTHLHHRHPRSTYGYAASPEATVGRVTSKSPRIDWAQLQRWYQVVLNAGQDWRSKLRDDSLNPWPNGFLSAEHEAEIEADIAESCRHLRRTLLKATETILRRPGRPLKNLGTCRFLLLLLENPLLYSIRLDKQEPIDIVEIKRHNDIASPRGKSDSILKPRRPEPGIPKSHTGIVKRLLGLIANASPENQRYLVSCFARYEDDHLKRVVDLVGVFVTRRLRRQRRSFSSSEIRDSDVLVPDIAGPGAATSAYLHVALGTGTTSGSPRVADGKTIYHDDWQIKAAAKVMLLLFQANNTSSLGRHVPFERYTAEPRRSSPSGRYTSAQMQLNATALSSATDGSPRAAKNKRSLPISAFYNTLLDYCNLVTDFESWENRQAGFSFCQYPMFLSIWAKIKILEYDARRQMEMKARQAFFNSIMSRRVISQYLVLRVRRQCLVEDSLRGVSEAVGSDREEIKKGLRIAFQGEEGVDAGGLRKEWFLLLVREVFDPDHGLFVYDEDSHYCYFNPNTFETSDQYFLIGVVLGLAIYNSTILDVALPPFAFRKLLASAPSYTGPATSMARPSASPTLADLAEFRPSLALGLQRLLEYEGDVQETFCRDFVVDVDRYGELVQSPLCPSGESKAVTNANRAEFVELYVKYLLDVSVSRQFEPFKRGFFSVCGGNALSLFRPEEIELLVRGSDEPLDVTSLRAVAIYDGWKKGGGPADDAVIAWFWELFGESATRKQKALLSFITGSDRLPAMGATSLIIKLTCLGDETTRFPIARTCFNMIGLYRYGSKEELQDKLWRAVAESEGFGLK